MFFFKVPELVNITDDLQGIGRARLLLRQWVVLKRHMHIQSHPILVMLKSTMLAGFQQYNIFKSNITKIYMRHEISLIFFAFLRLP